MEKHQAPQIESSLRGHGILKMPMECYGASGIIINGRRIKTLVFTTDIAIIRNCDADIAARLAAGASIINVACAAETPKLVRQFRKEFPDLPIIASGGPTSESIKYTIDSGANAVTYTPPSTAELFKTMMEHYRE